MVKEPLIDLSWSDISLYCDVILNQLKEDNIEIDSILGVARGGMVPATILSYSLNNPYMEMLGVRTREVDDPQFYGNPTLFGNVLVIDDINDSGLTFEVVSKYIDHHFDRGEVKNVYYSACVKRSSSKWNKGYYGIEHEGSDWFVFPWDK